MSAALRYRFGPFDDGLSGMLPAPARSWPHQETDASLLLPTTGCASNNMDNLRAPIQDKASSNLGTEDEPEELHICQQCRHEFSRLCDLNKHAKSHSRPFKCPHQDCKYYCLGWPTAKERERHVNDKHLAAPEMFPCLFPRCPYKSKRDSNRKQHMEKVHGWEYVRSKSNGRRLSRSEGTLLSSHAKSAAVKAPVDNSRDPNPGLAAQNPNHIQQHDFLLYDQDVKDSAMSSYDSDDLDDDLLGSTSQETDVVVPWTSPETRLQRRKTDLQKFSEKFHHGSTTAGEDVPVDPQLSSLHLYALGSQPMDNGAGSTRRLGYSPPSEFELGISTDISTAVRSSASATYSPSFRQLTRSTAASNSHGGLFSAAPQPTKRQAPPVGLIPIKRREDDGDHDGDGEHVQKKLKASSSLDFNDREMPDIFYAAFPETYNIDKKAVYKSCHTPHQEISTLVRHLGRPPHRLKVEERFISSFDVQPFDEDRFHRRVGVCRRCWQEYMNREEFEGHISTTCQKVSKGKREKWDILYDAFTPYIVDAISELEDDTAVAGGEDGTVISHSHVRPEPIRGTTTLGRLAVDSDDAPHDAPSPTTIELGPPECRELESPRDRTCTNHQLQTALRTLRHLSEGILSICTQGQLQNGTSLNNSDAQKLRQLHGVARQVRDAFNGRRQVLPEDTQQSLLGLAIHETEMPQEGMMDDINSQQDNIISQQPLSRSSSGLTSDRVTVGHVPTSPPQPFEDFTEAGRNTGFLHASNPSTDTLAIRHPPPSHPDSGYISGNRSSLTEAEAARMKDSFPPDGGLQSHDQPGGSVEAKNTTAGYQYHGYQQQPAAEYPDFPSPSTCFEGLGEDSEEVDLTKGLELIDDFYQAAQS